MPLNHENAAMGLKSKSNDFIDVLYDFNLNSNLQSVYEAAPSSGNNNTFTNKSIDIIDVKQKDKPILPYRSKFKTIKILVASNKNGNFLIFLFEYCNIKKKIFRV
jgi:hypothetical protein